MEKEYKKVKLACGLCWLVAILSWFYVDHVESHTKDPVEEHIDIQHEVPYVQEKYLEEEELHDIVIELPKGGHLTASAGVFQGPSGKETWYNLPMVGVIEIMREMGYSEEDYPYSIRDDGCKMLGDYIMVAANLDIRPRGTIVHTSLGLGIVCDTGDFAKENETQIDIATNW